MIKGYGAASGRHMASHGGLTLAQEALGTRASVAAQTQIMLTLGLILFATGLVVMSLESFGVAMVFYGIALALIRFA
jgi:hypothetical protein